MDIQKHGFYIGLGGALLVYILIFVFLVAPYGKDIKKNIRKLKGSHSKIKKYLKKKNDLPNDKIIAYHKDRKEKLKKSLAASFKFFEDKDKLVEKWFDVIADELKKSGKDLPELDFFQVVYAREKDKLIESYANKTKGMTIGKSQDNDLDLPSEIGLDAKEKLKVVRDILPLVEPRAIVTNSQMRKVQKQFWFIKHFIEIYEKGRLHNLTKFKFINQWREGGDETFITRSVEFSGQIKYKNITFLLQEILNNPLFMTILKKVEILRDKNYKPQKITVPVKWQEEEEDALEKFLQSNPGKVKLPLVLIKVQFDVFDYNNKTQR